MRFLIITESCSFSHLVKPLLFIEDMKKLYPQAEFIVCATQKYASLFSKEKFVSIEGLNIAKMYTRMANDQPLFTREDLQESFRRDALLIEEHSPDVIAFDLAFGAGLYAKQKGIKSVALITGSQHPGSYISKTPPNSLVRKAPFFFKLLLPFSSFIAPLVSWLWFRRDSLPIREVCKEFNYPSNLSILEYMSYADVRYVFDSSEMILSKESKDFFYGFFDWDQKEPLNLEITSFVRRAKESKLIFLSLGTAPLLTLNNFNETLTRAVRILLDKGYFVLVAGKLDLSHENLMQVSFLNQHLILKESDCFVHYGGCLSLFSGFVNHVPQVVFPFIYDQHVYAEYYSKKEVLKFVYGALTSPKKLAEVIEESFSDLAFRERVLNFSFQNSSEDLEKIRKLLK